MKTSKFKFNEKRFNEEMIDYEEDLIIYMYESGCSEEQIDAMLRERDKFKENYEE